MSNPDIARVLQNARTEFSWRRRLGQVCLFLAATFGAIAVGSLLATEVGLPNRTRLAFLVLLMISASWSGYALWTLMGRRALLANQDLVAARLAIACTTAFFLGAASLWASTGQPSTAVASIGGAVLTFVAVLRWAFTRRRYRALRALEAKLSDPGDRS